jgi:hypothetical protein
MRELLGAPIHDSYLLDPRLLDETADTVRASLGEDDFRAASRDGSRMNPESAARFVATRVLHR